MIEFDYPSLLQGERPHVYAYPLETIVAEKVEAVVKLGILNSRMKDFYDLYMIAGLFEFKGSMLANAMKATFTHRGTAIPAEVPAGLSTEFGIASDQRWKAFLRTNGINAAPHALGVILETLRAFALPVLQAAARDEQFDCTWRSGSGWAR